MPETTAAVQGTSLPANPCNAANCQQLDGFCTDQPWALFQWLGKVCIAICPNLGLKIGLIRHWQSVGKELNQDSVPLIHWQQILVYKHNPCIAAAAAPRQNSAVKSLLSLARTLKASMQCPRLPGSSQSHSAASLGQINVLHLFSDFGLFILFHFESYEGFRIFKFFQIFVYKERSTWTWLNNTDLKNSTQTGKIQENPKM